MCNVGRGKNLSVLNYSRTLLITFVGNASRPDMQKIPDNWNYL
jgi:hypothetical protein